MDRTNLADELFDLTLGHATDPIMGYTVAWRTTSGEPVAARECPYMPEGNSIAELAIGRPGESFASIAPRTEGRRWDGIFTTVLHRDEVRRVAPLDPDSVPNDVIEAVHRTNARIGTPECPVRLQVDLARLWAAQGRAESEWVALMDVDEVLTDALLEPTRRRELAEFVAPLSFETPNPHNAAELDALRDRLVAGEGALHDYFWRVQSMHLDRVVAREARDLTQHHDRAIDPLIERLASHSMSVAPTCQPTRLEMDCRKALSAASLAHSDRGAELMFLRALPTEIRTTFADVDGSLLRDAGRIAREHVGPREARLVELRHQTGVVRGPVDVVERGR